MKREYRFKLKPIKKLVLVFDEKRVAYRLVKKIKRNSGAKGFYSILFSGEMNIGDAFGCFQRGISRKKRITFKP